MKGSFSLGVFDLISNKQASYAVLLITGGSLSEMGSIGIARERSVGQGKRGQHLMFEIGETIVLDGNWRPNRERRMMAKSLLRAIRRRCPNAVAVGIAAVSSGQTGQLLWI